MGSFLGFSILPFYNPHFVSLCSISPSLLFFYFGINLRWVATFQIPFCVFTCLDNDVRLDFICKLNHLFQCVGFVYTWFSNTSYTIQRFQIWTIEPDIHTITPFHSNDFLHCFALILVYCDKSISIFLIYRREYTFHKVSRWESRISLFTDFSVKNIRFKIRKLEFLYFS